MIDPAVVEKIKAREAEALSKGWEPDELWMDKPYNLTARGNEPGLIVGFRSEFSIGEITPQSIEIYRDDALRGKMRQIFISKRR